MVAPMPSRRGLACTLLAAAAAAACGSSPPPPAPPVPPVELVQAVEPAPPAEPAPPVPEEVPAEPAPPPKEPILSRLRDDAGPIPGLEGWTWKHVPDKTYCGGVRVTVVRGKKKLAAEDKPFADVLALAFPTGLDFSSDKRRETSTKKFDAWVLKLKQTAGDATAHYEKLLGAAADDAARARSIARMAQVNLHTAALLARAWIPTDVRTGEHAEEKTETYCEMIGDIAEPVATRAEEAIAVCAPRVPAGATDWWATLCATP